MSSRDPKTTFPWPGFVLAAFYAWALVHCFRPLRDPDIWWHLANGRFILQSFSIPRADPFSWTARGSPWVDSYWLYEIALYGAERWMGLGGVILSTALLVVLGLFFQERLLKNRGASWPIRVLALTVLLLGAEPRGIGWINNASSVTFAFLSALLWRMDRWRAKRSLEGAWAWALFFALWSNLHRGFLLGLIALALDWANEAWSDRTSVARRAGLAALFASATLANPYGFRLYRLIALDTRLSSQLVHNWAWTPWGRQETFWCVLTLFWALKIGAAVVRRDSGGFLAPLFLTWIGVRHSWGVPLCMLCVVPELAAALSKLARPALSAVPRLAGNGALAALPVFGLFCAAAAAEPRRPQVDMSRVPKEACDFIERQGIRGPFYNDYLFGGYWIWRFAGASPVFIDGRFPSVEGYIPVLAEINRAKAGSPEEWNDFLRSRGVRAVLAGYPEVNLIPNVFDLYFPRKEWILAYRDAVALVFVRREIRDSYLFQHAALDSGK